MSCLVDMFEITYATIYIIMIVIEYDRIDNSCFDDRQKAQRTVENVRSERSQARVQDQVK